LLAEFEISRNSLDPHKIAFEFEAVSLFSAAYELRRVDYPFAVDTKPEVVF
jgi:hypothetical protein